MVVSFRVTQAKRKIIPSDNLGNIGTSRMSRIATGSLISRSVLHNESECLCPSAVRICRVRSLKERKYQLSVAFFDDSSP